MDQKKRILIIENDSLIAKDIKASIERAGYLTAGIFNNPSDARDFLQNDTPDLILLDIQLDDDENGIEFHESIYKKIDVPVIYLTAISDKSTFELTKKAEPFGYLLKPFDDDELQIAIDIALHRFEIEKRLIAAEQFQNTILKSIADAVIATDAQNKVTYINPVAEAIIQVPQTRVNGKHISDLLRLIDFESEEEITITDLFKTNASKEASLDLPDNSKLPIELTSNAILNENKRVIGFSYVFHDISERKKNEFLLERKLKIEETLTSISHHFISSKEPDFNKVLKILGEGMGVNRSHIFLVDYENSTVSNTHEWVDSETSSEIEHIQNIRFEDIPNTLELLMGGDGLVLEDTVSSNFLKEFEREIVLDQNIKAVILIPILDGEGRVLGSIGVDETRSARKWIENEIHALRLVSEMIGKYLSRISADKVLRESEEHFRNLIQNSTDLLSIVDLEGRLVFQSPAVSNTLGYSLEEIENQFLIELIHPDDKLKVANTFLEFVKNKEHQNFRIETRLLKKNGNYIYVEALGSAYVKQGTFAGIVFNSRDVTDRVLTEKELIKAKENAEEMNRLKTTFLANMSHEIRTPLTGIMGFASILSSELENPEKREMAERIHTSGKRLLDTIDAILDLSKIEANKLQAAFSYVNVEDEVDTVIRLLHPLASQKSLSLKHEKMSETYVSYLDKTLFMQVLNNLIGNAIKYTEHGGVTVRTGSIHKSLNPINFIEIEDTGIGIAPTFLPQIFDEFRQESHGLARRFEGAGLGLTITKKLIELMGGEISVQSVKGEGTIFTVTFPCVDTEESIEPSKELKELIQNKHTSESDNASIIVTDDNEDSLQVYNFFLREQYQLTLVSSAEEALEILDKKTFDLVIMDINLGEGMDGVEAFELIQKKESLKNIPVIAVTAYAMKGDEERFLNYGFKKYISKPFPKETLLEIVRSELRKYNKHHE